MADKYMEEQRLIKQAQDGVKSATKQLYVKTYKYIYQVWLPKSGHNPVMNDELELYDERFQYGEPDSEMFIYVPIK